MSRNNSKQKITRMHSSRMRTVRSLTIVGGYLLGVYLPEGVPTWGVYLPRGYLSGTGGTGPGGACPGGVMWPIPSCIWCYLYAASTPTECQHQCSCLYSVTQVHGRIQPPLWTKWQTGAKILPCPKLRFRAAIKVKKCVCAGFPQFYQGENVYLNKDDL